jgi:ribosome-binding protein aMBF1 (putative translation factor)
MAKCYCHARRTRDFVGGAREASPTDALPGSPRKVDVLAARAGRRESLFSDRDTDQDERRGLAGRPTKNTGGVNRQTRPAGEVREGAGRRPKYVPEDVRALGGRVRHFRTRRGLSQGQLAKKAGLDRFHLCRLEAGHRYPTVSVLVCLARALGLTPDQLLGFASAPA